MMAASSARDAAEHALHGTHLALNQAGSQHKLSVTGVRGRLAASFRTAMLLITIEESPKSVTLRLEGKLIGPWVEEVEQCWRKVFATLGCRTVLVDLSAVDLVDPAGRSLLARMREAGFRMEAK